ncbi:Rh36 [macacine betaherpesvirus 3]|nr:Rh36 [macacine betaherpesvirus 3]
MHYINMPLRTLASCLVSLTLFMYIHSDYVYVSVLTRSHGLTWTSVGAVNETDANNLSNYSFTQTNVSDSNNSSNGNGSVTELSANCLLRSNAYVSTIWIFNCTNDTTPTMTEFWYFGHGYNHSNESCKSSLVNYLNSMCTIWTNYSDGANSSRKDHLSTTEVRCVLPESYSVNTTIHQYNDTNTESEDQGQKYHEMFPIQHTCSLVEALAFDAIESYVYISRLCWNIAQILALLCIVTVSLVVWIRFQYCGKIPCMCLLPPNVSAVPTCQDVIVENINQTEEDKTSLNSPVEPESSEITPILSASEKPCVQKPSVPPKPPTVSSQFKVMHALNKPCMLPKPPPKPTSLQSPKPEVFTFDEQDIQRHKEEISKQVKPMRIPVLAHPTSTLTRTTHAPRLPPPPRQATFSPRAPTMIPWDRKSQMSPVEYSSWRQQSESLPAELDPWNVNPHRWL